MIEEGKRESKDEGRGADGSKETVPSDGVEQEVVDNFNKKVCRTLGAVEAQENLPSKVVDTGWKGLSYKQPKSEEICLEADLGVNDDERETGEFIEERLSRLGLGNYRDGAAKKSDLKVGEDESRIVSRSILDECVQMQSGQWGLVKYGPHPHRTAKYQRIFIFSTVLASSIKFFANSIESSNLVIL